MRKVDLKTALTGKGLGSDLDRHNLSQGLDTRFENENLGPDFKLPEILKNEIKLKIPETLPIQNTESKITFLGRIGSHNAPSSEEILALQRIKEKDPKVYSKIVLEIMAKAREKVSLKTTSFTIDRSGNVDTGSYDRQCRDAEKKALAEYGIDRKEFLKEQMEFLKQKNPKAYFETVLEIMAKAREKIPYDSLLFTKDKNASIDTSSYDRQCRDAAKAALAEYGIDRTDFFKDYLDFLRKEDPRAFFKTVLEIMAKAREKVPFHSFSFFVGKSDSYETKCRGAEVALLQEYGIELSEIENDLKKFIKDRRLTLKNEELSKS